eukprot:4253290-Prymnesium_polylepis.1
MGYDPNEAKEAAKAAKVEAAAQASDGVSAEGGGGDAAAASRPPVLREIEAMSVKELKVALEARRVDYAGNDCANCFISLMIGLMTALT